MLVQPQKGHFRGDDDDDEDRAMFLNASMEDTKKNICRTKLPRFLCCHETLRKYDDDDDDDDDDEYDYANDDDDDHCPKKPIMVICRIQPLKTISVFLHNFFNVLESSLSRSNSEIPQDKTRPYSV